MPDYPPTFYETTRKRLDDLEYRLQKLECEDNCLAPGNQVKELEAFNTAMQQAQCIPGSGAGGCPLPDLNTALGGNAPHPYILTQGSPDPRTTFGRPQPWGLFYDCDLPLPDYNYYISGPMTGLPLFNFPQFNEVAAALRSRNYSVINPAEEVDQLLAFSSYDSLASIPRRIALLEVLTALLTKSNALILLPDWKGSRGARLERRIAKALEYPIFEWSDIK